jgi:hypothetical protein
MREKLLRLVGLVLRHGYLSDEVLALIVEITEEYDV